VRPKILSTWIKRIDWIKLLPVPEKKDQLLVEFILGDNIPIEALCFFGWGVARHFVSALNIGTMGFWWWRMPQHINRYYESLEDLDTKRQIAVERAPSLKIDWGRNRVLSDEDLGRVTACLVGLDLVPVEPIAEANVEDAGHDRVNAVLRVSMRH
jgi:hypothetical protein